MHDDDRLQLPRERDVSPELRMQVLLNATDPATALPPRKRPAWVPALAGLAAAAVIVTVAVGLLNRDETAEPPIAGQDVTSAPTVEPHDAFTVDIRQLDDPEKKAVRRSCLGPDPAETARHVLSGRLLHSAAGDIRAASFSNMESGNRYFCTPFGTATATKGETVVSNETPVVLVPDSHVQSYTPDADGSGATTVVDGAWFALSPGFTTIEVRIVVDGDAGEWHATQSFSGWVFASAWRHLSADEVTGDLSVEYRVLTVDGQEVAIPSVD